MRPENFDKYYGILTDSFSENCGFGVEHAAAVLKVPFSEARAVLNHAVLVSPDCPDAVQLEKHHDTYVFRA